MHKSATKCNETIGKWCKNKHGASKIIDTLETYQQDMEEVGDYRPISLVHSFAKLFTKLLANRLRPRMSQLVSTNQSAFIWGRNLHDNFLLVR
jgi:hypothetical protein